MKVSESAHSDTSSSSSTTTPKAQQLPARDRPEGCTGEVMKSTTTPVAQATLKVSKAAAPCPGST